MTVFPSLISALLTSQATTFQITFQRRTFNWGGCGLTLDTSRQA